MVNLKLYIFFYYIEKVMYFFFFLKAKSNVFHTRLSKSGSYVKSWEVGEIVDRKIGSWIVRSYII